MQLCEEDIDTQKKLRHAIIGNSFQIISATFSTYFCKMSVILSHSSPCLFVSPQHMGFGSDSAWAVRYSLCCSQPEYVASITQASQPEVSRTKTKLRQTSDQLFAHNVPRLEGTVRINVKIPKVPLLFVYRK